jgi:hypothetical protein
MRSMAENVPSAASSLAGVTSKEVGLNHQVESVQNARIRVRKWTRVQNNQSKRV